MSKPGLPKDIKELVIEDIVNEAGIIDKKCKEYRKKRGHKLDENDFGSLHKRIQEEHHSFISTYPVVVRSIVYEDKFKKKALERYILHLKNHPWNNKEEYLERQADWYVCLERETNPRIGAKALAQFRDKVRRHLIEEDKEFMKAANATKEEVEKERDEIIEDRKARIRDVLKQVLTANPAP